MEKWGKGLKGHDRFMVLIFHGLGCDKKISDVSILQ